MALVIGENIGTTITANFAAVVANMHARRAARAHLFFNLFGASWMFLLLPVFVPLVENFGKFLGTGTGDEAMYYTYALTGFHTLFNLVNVALFIFFGLSERLTVLLNRWMPSRISTDEEYHLEYLESRLMSAPELSIVEVRNELLQFAKHVIRGYDYLPKILLEPDEKTQREYKDQVEHIERLTDKMEYDIANYLARVSAGDISSEARERARNMLSASNYLERIADITLKIAIYMVNRKGDKAYFLPEQRSSMQEFMQLVRKSLELMRFNLQSQPEELKLKPTRDLEKEINLRFMELKKAYLKGMEKGKYKIQSGLYYNDLLSELERLADHVERVSEVLEVHQPGQGEDGSKGEVTSGL
jgi:phosphate:Na+ symporter